MKQINIGIAINSPIIYNGLCSVIDGVPDCNVNVVNASDQDFAQLIGRRLVSVLIVDPLISSVEEISELKKAADGRVKFAAIYHSALPPQFIKVFDESISIYDDADTIKATIKKLAAVSTMPQSQRELTQREQEIVKCVVRGMSNKEIANQVNLSVNTVMTHRRNIAAKLQIHSPAGLTIYALVSKLVKLDEISTEI